MSAGRKRAKTETDPPTLARKEAIAPDLETGVIATVIAIVIETVTETVTRIKRMSVIERRSETERTTVTEIETETGMTEIEIGTGEIAMTTDVAKRMLIIEIATETETETVETVIRTDTAIGTEIGTEIGTVTGTVTGTGMTETGGTKIGIMAVIAMTETGEANVMIAIAETRIGAGMTVTDIVTKIEAVIMTKVTIMTKKRLEDRPQRRSAQRCRKSPAMTL